MGARSCAAPEHREADPGSGGFDWGSGFTPLRTGQSWQQNVTARRAADPGTLWGDDQKK